MVYFLETQLRQKVLKKYFFLALMPFSHQSLVCGTQNNQSLVCGTQNNQSMVRGTQNNQSMVCGTQNNQSMVRGTQNNISSNAYPNPWSIAHRTTHHPFLGL